MGFRTQRDVDRLTLPRARRSTWNLTRHAHGLAVRLQGTARVWMVRDQLPSGSGGG